MFIKASRQGERPLGKIDASLNEKLQSVKWGEYKIDELFVPCTIKCKLSKEDLSDDFLFSAYSAETENGGVIGYTNIPEFICNGQTPFYVIFGDHTRVFNIAKESFSVLDNVKVLRPRINSERTLLFIISAWAKLIPNLGYARHWKVAKDCIIQLPTKNGQIDIDFIESFIAELEARHIAELEARHIAELEAYLTVTGLKDYTLTKEEEKALVDFNTLNWMNYNLEDLFSKSTRGKRLKSADRVQGDLPFVTAGEACEGVSAYIGNDVEIFESNTTTIDMFGSAKYRNFRYGADDHVAVVHTEKLPKHAAIFVTTAIHKSSHTGKFDYSRNFYAKDADELDILLPSKENKPDYSFMSTLISAIQKLVIKDVVLYFNRKIDETKKVIAK